MRYFFYAIVVQIQEDECGQADQVLNFRNVIVLQVQKSEALLSFQEGHVGQLSLVEVQPIRIGISLRWLPVDDEHTWNLRQLCKYDLVFVFDPAHYSVFEEVAVTFIFFVRREFCRGI